MAVGKWLLGGLGFVLGGPIGALMGFFIGWAFEDKKVLPSGETGGGGRRYTTQRPTQGDIHVSILVLIAAVMKADGHIRKAELDVVKQYLLRNYGEEQAKQALRVLKGLLEQNIDVMAVTAQIRQNVNYSLRLQIVHFLLDIANADEDFAKEEETIIVQIAAGLSISDSDMRSLFSLYRRQDPEWAYKALEIEKSATDEEVKKAYRRMAMKYHPDKVGNVGEDIKNKATEKFRAINTAYETIKAERGMK